MFPKRKRKENLKTLHVLLTQQSLHKHFMLLRWEETTKGPKALTQIPVLQPKTDPQALNLNKKPDKTAEATPLFSPQNDFWEMSAEIPHRWHVTAKIWVLLLIGWSKFPSWQDQSLRSTTQNIIIISMEWNIKWFKAQAGKPVITTIELSVIRASVARIREMYVAKRIFFHHWLVPQDIPVANLKESHVELLVMLFL